MIDLKGPHAEVIAKLNMPAELRHPRPGRVGRERDPRQARGHRTVAGDAARVPRRRTAGDTELGAGRGGVVGRGRRAGAARRAALTHGSSPSPRGTLRAGSFAVDPGGPRGRSVQAESTVRAVGPARAARAVRRRGVGAARRQLQVGGDEAVRGARRLGRHRARARREDAPRHALLQARVARRAVAQAAARAARDEPGSAHQAGQRGDGALRRGDDRARGVPS